MASAAARVDERPRNVHEAADECGLSVHTIRSWIVKRKIEYMRLGRTVRIPAAEIRRIKATGTVPALRER
jgi:excisionase family DNA binding protein